MNPWRPSLWFRRLPLLLLTCLGAGTAQAQISCSSTSMSALSFGNVDPLTSLTNFSATLNYTCSNASSNRTWSARVCFSIGEPGGGQTNPRLMSSGANKLQFQLYRDPGRTLVWGSQYFGSFLTPLEVTMTLGSRATTSGSATLYGQVLGGQTGAIPGSYTQVYQNGDTAVTINDVQGSTAPAGCDSAQTGNYFPFTVSAAVVKRCLVNAATDIDLNTVPASATNISGNGNISITCSNTTPYNVGLLPSNGHTGGAGAMSGTSGNTDKVPYQLYQNAGYSTVWGNTATASSTGNGIAGTGTGAARSHTVYVRAPSADYTPGSYSDTVTVNVNY